MRSSRRRASCTGTARRPTSTSCSSPSSAAATAGRPPGSASRIMRRTPTNADSPEEPAAWATTISGPVLPGLQGRRSPEQAARIATRRHLLEFVQMFETRRAELGLSRSAIARQLGVTQPTISRLFSGHVQNIELKTMVRGGGRRCWTPIWSS